MKVLILVLTLSVVNSRPQGPPNPQDGQAVQIEKQEIREVTQPQSKTLLGNDEETKRFESTKEILEKIVEVNKRHGLTPKGLRTNQDYVQIPTIQRSGVAKQQNFEFPKSPFTNPIFEYINGNDHNEKSREGSLDKATTYSVVKTNAEVNPEDQIPGQYIKRKITHHQTFIMPGGGGMMGNYYNQMPNYFSQVPQMQGVPQQMPILPPQMQGVPPQMQGVPPQMQGVAPQMPYMLGYPNQLMQQQAEQPQSQPPADPKESSSQPSNVKQTLENQTVENIKNIVNKQIPPPVVGFNPYSYAAYPYAQPYAYYGMPNNQQEFADHSQLSSNSFRVNGPNARLPNEILFQQLPRPSRQQQWQWPLAQFFPIVIKDPFQQIYNAFTSMVEYGQQNGDALCADVSKSDGVSNNKISRSGKSLGVDPREEERTDQPITLDIENLEMTDDKKNPMKFTFNFKAAPDAERFEKDIKQPDPSRLNHKLPQLADILNIKNPPTENKIKTGLENSRIKDNDHVKIVSQDNTGNGIFIHRLKVRKGGVAIAGPGGIATAGSGGTAIVGPNGYAYTQPDSLAIAGTGTKVIAVNPGVNLSEVIAHVNANKTVENPRLGKIVAVGPVVYYNKG